MARILRVTDSGEILEIEPLPRAVIRWQNEWVVSGNRAGLDVLTSQAATGFQR